MLHNRHVRIALSRFLTIALALGLSLPSLAEDWRLKADPWVVDRVARDETVEVLVVLESQARLESELAAGTRIEKGSRAFSRLTGLANRDQGPILEWLRHRGLEHRSFWIVNAVWVRADLAALKDLAAMPEVARLTANPEVRHEGARQVGRGTSKRAFQTVEWNIAAVGAPSYWAQGFEGQGVVIGIADSGFDWDHPALLNQYRGWDGAAASHDYHWRDAILEGGGDCSANSMEPCDDHGHGTFTLGLAVGDDGGTNQIGVAPGAKWIGCRNMDQGAGTPATYLDCFEFFLAPTDLMRENPDPALAPHMVTNSWRCPPSEGCTDPTVLQMAVENLRAAGIAVIAAASNEGPSCESLVDPPAIYEASFTVGSVNQFGELSAFSARGPVTSDGSGRMKPDLVAPGENIRSSDRGGLYLGGQSGTSLSAPQVAGLMALVQSAAPYDGDVDGLEGCLTKSAVGWTTDEGCGGDGADQVPNNSYGWGIAELTWPPAAACQSPIFTDGFESGDTTAWSD